MPIQHEIEITPAWDKTSTDPNKNYGVHCAELRCYVKGDLGVIQFILYTGWYLPHVVRKHPELNKPIPVDLGYHSPKPMYEGQSKMDTCQFIKGECFYDGSGLMAQEIYDILLVGGTEAMWKKLDEVYIERFGSLI